MSSVHARSDHENSARQRTPSRSAEYFRVFFFFFLSFLFSFLRVFSRLSGRSRAAPAPARRKFSETRRDVTGPRAANQRSPIRGDIRDASGSRWPHWRESGDWSVMWMDVFDRLFDTDVLIMFCRKKCFFYSLSCCAHVIFMIFKSI